MIITTFYVSTWRSKYTHFWGVSSTANVHWLLKVNTARLETYWTVAMVRQNKYVYSLAQTAMCVCNSVSRYLAHKATIEKSGFNSQLPHCHGITASAWATLLHYFRAYSPHMWKSQNAPKWVPRQHKLKKKNSNVKRPSHCHVHCSLPQYKKMLSLVSIENRIVNKSAHCMFGFFNKHKNHTCYLRNI